MYFVVVIFVRVCIYIIVFYNRYKYGLKKDNDINFKIIYFLQNKQDLQQLTTLDTKSRKMRNFFNETCNHEYNKMIVRLH